MNKRQQYISYLRIMLPLSLPAMILVSCVTIPKNYLEADKWLTKSYAHKTKSFSEHERSALNMDADSLIQSIELQKRQKKYLKANAINHLFVVFGNLEKAPAIICVPFTGFLLQKV